jgi:hypothetical protein
MTVHTLHRIGCCLATLDDIVHQIAMTIQTVLLKDLRIARRNHDRFVKILQCESSGMTITVIRFGQILCDECMWQVTVYAHRGAVMGPLGPRHILVIHDVTIRTGARVRREITQTLAVMESEGSDSEHEAREAGKHNIKPKALHDSLCKTAARTCPALLRALTDYAELVRMF